MSSTVTKRTRDLREQLTAVTEERDRMLDAIEEWAEARYRLDELRVPDHRWHAANRRLRDAESTLLVINGRRAW